MAIVCLNCGYRMKSNQEIQSAIIKSGYDLVEWMKTLKVTVVTIAVKVLLWILGGLQSQLSQNIFAGHLNSGPNKVKCPNCGVEGRWSDV